jgi:hypothetical protein
VAARSLSRCIDKDVFTRAAALPQFAGIARACRCAVA